MALHLLFFFRIMMKVSTNSYACITGTQLDRAASVPELTVMGILHVYLLRSRARTESRRTLDM